jgi:hypothetical protein
MKMLFLRALSRLLPLVAFALAIFIISAPAAFADSAQLIIHRSANFGNHQWLQIWIDGNQFESIAIGHDFIAPLSPGRHVVSILQTDNPWHFAPTNRALTVRAGRTYEFTAVRRNDRVFLEEHR